MRLRRGMVRESCDFCHRRKIKCDRLTRNDLGHTSCSQCSLRNVPCRMEDSDDIRLRGRCRPGEVPVAVSNINMPAAGAAGTPLTKRESFGSEDAGKSDAQQQQSQPQPPSQTPQSQLPPPPTRGLSISSASASASAPIPRPHPHSHPHPQVQAHHAHTAPPPQSSHPLTTPAPIGLDVHLLAQSHANIPSHPSHQTSQHVLPHHQHQQQQQQHPQQLYTPSPSTATSISVYGNPAPSLTDDLFMEDPFQLNADSIFFLDKIFMGDPDAAMWPNQGAPNGVMAAGYQQPLMPFQSEQDFVQQQQQQQHLQEYQQQQHQLQQQQQQQYQQYQSMSQPQSQPQQPTQQQLPPPPPPPQQREVQDGGYDPAPWVRCDIPRDIFIAALHAYFEYTTIYMPVLLEDAFWQDYHAGRCSLSIIYALACRGLPFTAGIERNEDKWAMQQRVGTQFRETFFETQLAANNNRGRVRLDDLEALALMVQFKYHKHQGTEDASSQGQGQQASPTPSAPSPAATALAQLHAHLAGLYLTHDSLVLMTMQSGINGSGGAGSGGIGVGGNHVNQGNASASNETDDATAPLARINDRRILLFWHVYGLDSFQCLDKKTLSRIPDFNIDTVRNLPRENKVSPGSGNSVTPAATGTARGYLDAVLDLSIIARKALTTLSNATARRRGVRAEDALHIYSLLDTWLQTECPPHLRHQRDANGRLCLTGDGGSSGGSGTNTPGNSPYVQLHRAVVWILAINCYMQIEDCVSEYGIYQSSPSPNDSPQGQTPSPSKNTLDSEILYLRIMSETVRHMRDGVDIARAIKTPKWDGSPNSKREYSLADLGTSVVRDCCQGMGMWACARGISWLKRPLPRVLSQTARQQQQRHQNQHSGQQGQQPPLNMPSPEEQKRREDADRRKHAETYLESASILRDAVATASSHADTMPSLRKLDELVAELAKGIEQIGR